MNVCCKEYPREQVSLSYRFDDHKPRVSRDYNYIQCVVCERKGNYIIEMSKIYIPSLHTVTIL